MLMARRLASEARQLSVTTQGNPAVSQSAAQATHGCCRTQSGLVLRRTSAGYFPVSVCLPACLPVVPSSLQAPIWARVIGLIRRECPGEQAVGQAAACGNAVRVSPCADVGFPPALTHDTCLRDGPCIPAAGLSCCPAVAAT